MLGDGPLDAPPRLRSMRDAIAWSYDLLPADLQRLFRTLAIFPADFSLQAAEAVCAHAASLDPWSVLEGIGHLIDHSLLTRWTTVRDEPRFVMLETLREFGPEHLAARDARQEVAEAHARYAIDLMGENGSMGRAGREFEEWMDRAEREIAHLRVALNWLLEHGEGERALRFAYAHVGVWWARGHINEGRDWLEHALAIAPVEERPLRTQALYWYGLLGAVGGDRATGLSAYEAVAMAERLGNRENLALAYGSWA